MASSASSASAVKDDSPRVPQLTCYFKSRNENGDDDASTETTSGKALLCQETGKKSSFLLQPKNEQSPKDTDTKGGINWYSVPKPGHLFVEQDNHPTDTKGFFFGGLQLIFDARNIEIYLTSPEGKESYLMTCKGIPYKMNGKENVSQESESKVEWRRALCVVPGGPRCISSLRIKLIGATSPPDSTTVKMQFLKLTARIVNASAPSPRTPATPQRVKANPQSFSPNMFGPPTMNMNATSDSEPPLTQKDLGAAMAGLSFMARKTEENMANLIKEQSKEIEDRVEAYMTRMELQMRALKPTLAMQLQLIKENQIIMKEQQQIMECQSTQMNKLLSDNQDLQVRVQSLQADISILRSQGTHDSTRDANSISNGADTEADIDVDASTSRVTASQLSSEQPLNDAEYSPPVDAVDTKKDIEAENARLRNVIQKIEGIDGESLFGGCGATANRPSSNALSVNANYYDAETENIRLRNAVRTVSQVYEEPLIEGCGVGSSAKYAETKRNVAMEEEAKVAVLKRLKEAEKIDSGCGYLLEGILLGKIESAMASRIKPSDIPIDATRSLENIKKKYSDELSAHTPTIEVELMQQEIEKAASSDLQTIDEQAR